MFRFGAALLAKESSVASMTFALFAAGLLAAAAGLVGILGAKSYFLIPGFDAVLAYAQVYRLAWDASDMQFSVRSQQNERYYVNDPGSSLSQDHVGSVATALADCAKRVILEA